VNRNERDQLRNLLHHKARAVRGEAIETGGQVTAEALEGLGRLAHLVELCEAAEPPPLRNRLPMVAALGITLLIVSILLFARVSETEIELELTLSEVGFVLPKEQVLSHRIPLLSLGIAGLREIELPRAQDREAQTLGASDGIGNAIRLSIDLKDSRRSTLSLAPLILPKGTEVWLYRAEVPHKYRLSLKVPELVLRADVNGLIRVGWSEAAGERLEFSSPKSIVLKTDSGGVDLD
jgi:hypothetical protein